MEIKDLFTSCWQQQGETQSKKRFCKQLIDNICIQPLASPVVNTAGLMNQGMFINSSPYWRLEDTVSFYLRKYVAPYILVDSTRSVISGSPYMNNVLFSRALTGNYYLTVKHRNSIETWSSVPISYTRGGTF